MAKYNIGDSRVIESREVSDGVTIRRRRETPDGKRFTTYERIERPNLAVVKKSGIRELFDRDKLAIAIKRSVGKFFSSEVEVEEMISNIEDEIYAIGENEISSKEIGEKVLDELLRRNEVAYVRFASVFHEFKTLDDFVRILEQRRKQKKEGGSDASNSSL
ncbi:MAG: transcriptional regulator NrdR [Candidatus Saccharimonadales bacterium]